MNEQVANELVKWMQGLGQLAQEQAPALAHDIVVWGICGSILDLFIVAACTVGAYFAGRYCLEQAEEAQKASFSESDKYVAFSTISGIVSAILGCTAFFVGTSALTTLVKAIASPQLYVAQEVAKMVSGS